MGLVTTTQDPVDQQNCHYKSLKDDMRNKKCLRDAKKCLDSKHGRMCPCVSSEKTESRSPQKNESSN